MNTKKRELIDELNGENLYNKRDHIRKIDAR